MSAKIIDFGSVCISNKIEYTYIQSRFYRAPEVVFELKYGAEIDIWSLACVFFEAYEKRPLFPCRSDTELIEMIKNAIGPPGMMFVVGCPQYTTFSNRNESPSLGDKSKSNQYTNKKILRLSRKNTDHRSSLGLNLIISKMLKWRPKDRIDCATILNYDYFRLNAF